MPARERNLWMDRRQAATHPLWVGDDPVMRHAPGTLAYEGFRVHVTEMPFGDYRIQLDGTDPFSASNEQTLVIESKTWPDLMASVRDDGAGREDSRIRHQLGGLLELQGRGYQACVLLVGQLTLAGGRTRSGARPRGLYVDVNGRRQKRNWSYHEVEAVRQAIEHLGVMTAIAPSEDETPHTLKVLADVCERTEHFPAPGLPRLASLSPGLGTLATIFTACEGIGPGIALQIAEAVGSFPAFMELDQRALESIPGVGKVNAARLWQTFHSARNVSTNGATAQELLDAYEPAF